LSTMRRSKKEITDQRVINNLLLSSHVGRLGTRGKDGYPRIKPLNFVYSQGSIYFHSAFEGEKIADITRDSRVCFEIDHPIAFVEAGEDPCKAEYLYQSIIIRGRASLVQDKTERETALLRLMEKYQPRGGYGKFLEEKLAVTAVIRVDIAELTGKEDLGKPPQET
jgi:uncharacterized protein